MKEIPKTNKVPQIDTLTNLDYLIKGSLAQPEIPLTESEIKMAVLRTMQRGSTNADVHNFIEALKLTSPVTASQLAEIIEKYRSSANTPE